MITTVCMNPSFDKTASVESLTVGGLNRMQDVRYDAGGKGIKAAVVTSQTPKRRLGLPKPPAPRPAPVVRP